MLNKTKPLPGWIQKRYAKLWKKYNSEPVDNEQIAKTLKGSKHALSTFISDLKKAGWIEVSLHPQDSRKRIYKLISPNEAFKRMEL